MMKAIMLPLERKIRILHLINSLAIGGAERLVVDLVNGLDPGGFESTICCIRRSGPCAEWIQREGVEVIELEHGDGNNPILPLKIARLIRKHRIAVVHCHGWAPFCEGATAAHLAGALAMILTDHGRVAEDFIRGDFIARWKRRLRHRIEYFLTQWTDRVVVVSDCLRELLVQEVGLSPSKITTLVNGISLPLGPFHREEKRKELGFATNDLVVCSVGRLAAIKNFQLFLETAPAVLGQVPNTRFLLVGDGPERSSLEALRRQYGLEMVVTLLGDRRDVPDLLAASDLFVLPSDFEATSISLLEAMGVGLPVVATRVGGNSFIVADRETGYLVPPRDAGSLSSATVSLLRNQDLRSDMGQKGKERVRRLFSMERMLASYEHLYLQILEEKGKFHWKALANARAKAKTAW